MRRLLLHASCLCYRAYYPRNCILITGASGSGKSILFTALRSIEYIDTPSGRIYNPFLPMADDHVWLFKDGYLRPYRGDLIRSKVIEGRILLLISLNSSGSIGHINLLDNLLYSRTMFKNPKTVIDLYSILYNLMDVPLIELERDDINKMKEKVISYITTDIKYDETDDKKNNSSNNDINLLMDWRRLIILPYANIMVLLSTEDSIDPLIFMVEEDSLNIFNKVREQIYKTIINGEYVIKGSYISIKIKIDKSQIKIISDLLPNEIKSYLIFNIK